MNTFFLVSHFNGYPVSDSLLFFAKFRGLTVSMEYLIFFTIRFLSIHYNSFVNHRDYHEHSFKHNFYESVYVKFHMIS